MDELVRPDSANLLVGCSPIRMGKGRHSMNNGAVIRQNRGDSTIGARIDLGDDTLNEHVLRGMENVEDRLRVELEKVQTFFRRR